MSVCPDCRWGWTWPDLLFLFIAYISGLFVAIAIGNGIFFMHPSTQPYSPLIAAVLEPIFSKLVPAIGILYWAQSHRQDLVKALQIHPFWFGAYGGACIGILEAIGKVVRETGMYANVNTITVGVGLAALGHILYGGIIGNAVFREKRSRPWHNWINATLLVILIHLIWNGYQLIELVNQVQ